MEDARSGLQAVEIAKIRMILQSLCNSVYCTWAGLYHAQPTGLELVVAVGTLDHIDEAVAGCVLNRRERPFTRDTPIVVSDLPEIASADGDDDHTSQRVRFIAHLPLYDGTNTPCGVLVIADEKPKSDLSAAKQFVVKAHAVMAADLLTQGSCDDVAAVSGLTPAAQAQIERLRLLESVVVNANDAVLITEAEPIDAPGPRILYCNDAFTRTTGYSEAEVLGLSPRILQTERTDRKSLDRLRAALMAWEPIEVELLNRRKDGTEIWVELSIVPVSNEVGWYTHWVSVQRDITDRKNAQELAERARLMEAENLLLSAKVIRSEEVEKELTEAHRLARLGTWRLARDRRTMIWSNDVYDMFGLDASEQFPTVAEMMAIIRPADRDAVQTCLQAVFDQCEPQQTEFAIPIGAHETRYCRIEARPVFNADSTVDGAFGFCQDITQQKLAEQALLRSERLKTIGQLTGGIAHDFNNLLTVTTLNIEEAIHELGASHPAHELLSPALLAAERAAELTSSLLSYALQAQLRPRRIDLAKMLGELSTLLGRTLGEQHRVQVNSATLIDELHADPAQLESALMNLAINARDAMPDGGKITITAGKREVVPGMVCLDGELKPGQYAVIDVVDEGTGMSPELLTRVFEPFFTTKAPHRGSGLGLSMVYGFARQSGGNVRIVSSPGKGTTVSLYFPLKAAAIGKADAQPEKSQWQANGLRVLLVEDQRPVLDAVTRMLQQFGCDVMPVETAAAALSVMHEQPAFDLLFSDIVLPPPMNGTDLATEAKRISPGLRVLLTSGFAENGAALVDRSKCDEFLSKPYGREKLRKLLSDMFSDMALAPLRAVAMERVALVLPPGP